MPSFVDKVKMWLLSYFKKERPEPLKLPLFTENQVEKEIILVLQMIPYGETYSYQKVGVEVEKRINHKVHPITVGRLISKNPFLIIYPCHRVIKKDGSIGGFSAGTSLKKTLLSFEKNRYFK